MNPTEAMPDYTYLEHVRQRWIFADPNEFGAFLTFVIILITISSGRLTCGHRPALRRIVAVVAIVLLAMTLASTYSRGAWVGAVCGLCFGALCLRKLRWVGIAVSVLLVVVLLKPGGGARAASIGSFQSDPAISNRVSMWKAALHMIDEAPLGGWGTEYFRQEYAAWHQPASNSGRPRTPVNTFLTICLENGIFLCGLIVVAVVSTALAAIQCRNEFAVAGAAALVGLACAGIFTDLNRWAFVAMAVTCVVPVLLATVSWTKREWVRFAMQGSIGLLCIVGLFMSVALFGRYASNESDVRHGSYVVDIDGRSHTVIEATPSRSEECGTVVYFDCDDNDTRSLATYLLKPLARAGYRTMVFRPSDTGFRGQQDVADVVEVISGKQKDIILAGAGPGGRLAIVAAADIKEGIGQVIAANCEARWPFAELSPQAVISKVKAEVVLLTRSSQDEVAENDLAALLSLALTAQVKAKRVIMTQTDLPTTTGFGIAEVASIADYLIEARSRNVSSIQ